MSLDTNATWLTPRNSNFALLPIRAQHTARHIGGGAGFTRSGRTRQTASVVVPARDVEDRRLAADVVLDADVEVLTAGVEDATGPLRSQIVQRRDADASVGQEILVLSVGQAVPQVVVVRELERGLGILVHDRIAGERLEGDV